ncbi:MAG: efflux RND transporter periplasmic adaptor subunit [Planctomycetota bacterium]|nr:efflux RND transporter periplasmic adaptor subunit [Planctomycetota bacterium]
MPRVHSAVLAAFLSVPCLVAACSGGSSGSDAAAPAVKQREAVRVRTALVERREMVRTISTTTTVVSEREIEIMPRASEVVTRVLVEEGDWVEAGAVLAELDRRASQSAIDSARISLRDADDAAKKAQFALLDAQNRVATTKLRWEQATREHERNEKAGMISAQALDNLRTARDTAQSEHEGALLAVERAQSDIQAVGTQKAKAEVALERAQLEDSYMVLSAPFQGTIAQRNLRVGDSAGRIRNAAGQIASAFVLTDSRALRATVNRPQRELPMFLAAQKAARQAALHQGDGAALEIRAMAEALPGRTFAGEILLVSPSIDPASGSFRVTVGLPPTEPGAAGLLPGMLVRLEIVTERHPDALVVPKRALRREGGTDFVFAVEENRARRIEVREGLSDDESTEVLPVEGARLAAGARVIVVGNREIEDKAEVLEESVNSAPARPADEAATKPAAPATTGTSKG